MTESEIIEIVKDITKKNPVKGDKVFFQDQKNIYFQHTTDLLHELAHWIVSSNKDHLNYQISCLLFKKIY